MECAKISTMLGFDEITNIMIASDDITYASIGLALSYEYRNAILPGVAERILNYAKCDDASLPVLITLIHLGKNQISPEVLIAKTEPESMMRARLYYAVKVGFRNTSFMKFVDHLLEQDTRAVKKSTYIALEYRNKAFLQEHFQMLSFFMIAMLAGLWISDDDPRFSYEFTRDYTEQYDIFCRT